MRDEALHAAERFGEREGLQCSADALHGGNATGQRKADHCSKPALLASRDRVARMRGEPRVVNGQHGGMLHESCRDQVRVLFVHAHPREQRAHAAQREIAVERRTGESKTVGPPTQRLEMRIVACDDCTADNVAVPIQILRRGVHHEIGAQCERLLQCRRQERVVCNDDRSGAMPRLAHAPEIGNSQQRIARRLDPQHRRLALRDRLLDVRRGEIGQLELDLPLRGERAEQPICAAVAIMRGEHFSSTRHELQRQRDRRHAGARDHSTHAFFQLAQRAREIVARRISGARVVVLPLLVEAREGERRRQMDGRHHRTMMCISRNRSAHGARSGGW